MRLCTFSARSLSPTDSASCDSSSRARFSVLLVDFSVSFATHVSLVVAEIGFVTIKGWTCTYCSKDFWNRNLFRLLAHLCGDRELCKEGELVGKIDEAKKLATSLQSYPAEELMWLISTAWNQGAQHLRFGRLPSAERLLAAAVALREHAGPEAYGAQKAKMDEALADVRARLAPEQTAA